MLSGKYNFSLTARSSVRLAFIDKLNLSNSYSAPRVLSSKLFIDLKNLDNFDSPRLIAAVFVLSILSGAKPYVSRFNLFQTFHEKDYDAQVVVNLNSLSTFRFLELISTTILPFLAKADLSSYALKMNKGFLVNFTIADLSFIRVVETHSIFFKWHDKVNAQIFLAAVNSKEINCILSAFKLKVSF